MKTKRLGIIGGLGPETGCAFTLAVNNKVSAVTSCQPNLVLENVPVPFPVFEKIISGERSHKMLSLLIKAVCTLNRTNVDSIVIPCNTVHTFIEELRDHSKIPIISITEECAKECSKQRFKKVGVLATTTSIQEKLHEKELSKVEIQVIEPNEEDQCRINEAIFDINTGQVKNKNEMNLNKAIEHLKERGAEAIILGCTDLFLLIKEASIPLINTTEVLENAAVKALC